MPLDIITNKNGEYLKVLEKVCFSHFQELILNVFLLFKFHLWNAFQMLAFVALDTPVM